MACLVKQATGLDITLSVERERPAGLKGSLSAAKPVAVAYADHPRDYRGDRCPCFDDRFPRLGSFCRERVACDQGTSQPIAVNRTVRNTPS